MEFDNSDILAIDLAHTELEIWYSKNLKDVKKKIKDYLLMTCNHCCYCLRPFIGEFRMVIDVEHILPSSIFRELAFDFSNLTLSCKRCNMKIKKDNVDFVDGNLLKITEYLKSKEHLSRYIYKCERGMTINKLNRIIYSSNNYKFIHPLLDDYSQHLEYISIQLNNKKFSIYNPKTKKGVYMKDFFKLSDFQVRDLNVIQFLPDPDNLSDFNIPSLL